MNTRNINRIYLCVIVAYIQIHPSIDLFWLDSQKTCTNICSCLWYVYRTNKTETFLNWYREKTEKWSESLLYHLLNQVLSFELFFLIILWIKFWIFWIAFESSFESSFESFASMFALSFASFLNHYSIPFESHFESSFGSTFESFCFIFVSFTRYLNHLSIIS